MTIMPTACRFPGCPQITRDRYCPSHARLAHQQQDANRPSSSRRGYGGAWPKIRARFLRLHPWCGECHEARATEVDHIVLLSMGGTHQESNLRGRCKPCHSRRTINTHRGGGGQIAAIPQENRRASIVCSPSLENSAKTR